MESSEHIWLVDLACHDEFGKKLKVDVLNGSQSFSVGEISALAGDFFQSPDEFLAKAEPARKFIDKHYKNGNCDEFVCMADEIGNFEAVGLSENYLSYSLANFDHFRHGKGKQNAIDKYKWWHEQAIKQRDLLLEGFALHYLVDLFSSGHMRTPRGDSFFHLINNLDYDSRNAEIISGLISKTCHDLDNKNGVMCGYVPVSEYLTSIDTGTTGLLSSSHVDVFLGDGHLVSEVKKGWSDKQIQHLKSMICISIAEALYGGGSIGLKSTDHQSDHSHGVYRYFSSTLSNRGLKASLSGILNKDDYFDKCLPNPIQDNSQFSGQTLPPCLMYRTNDPSANLPRVAWRKPGKYPSIDLIDVIVHTNAELVISKIEIKIQYAYLACILSSACLAFTGSIDGNDSRVRLLFSSVNYGYQKFSRRDDLVLIEDV